MNGFQAFCTKISHFQILSLIRILEVPLYVDIRKCSNYLVKLFLFSFPKMIATFHSKAQPNLVLHGISFLWLCNNI